MKRKRMSKREVEVNDMLWAMVEAQAYKLGARYGIQKTGWSHWGPLFGEEFGEICSMLRHDNALTDASGKIVGDARGMPDVNRLNELIGIIAMCVEQRRAQRRDHAESPYVFAVVSEMRKHVVNARRKRRDSDTLGIIHIQHPTTIEYDMFLRAMAKAIATMHVPHILVVAYEWAFHLLLQMRRHTS